MPFSKLKNKEGQTGARDDRQADVTEGFLTFTLISGLGWLIDVAVTIGLVDFGASPFVASFVGAGTAVTFVYIVSRFTVFSAQKLGSVNDYAIYAVWQVVAITVASLLVAGIAYLLEPIAGRLGFAQRLPDALALATGAGKVLVTPLTLVANFLFMRWLTGRNSTPNEGGHA